MSQYNDYGNNPYGAATGGGYVQGSPFSASGSPGGVRRSEASHSLRPVTVAQLLKATQAHADADWMIDDAELGQVTVVGQVASIQAQATNCVYIIDDGTGRIEARHWVDSAGDEDAGKWDGIEEAAYVRVTGGLKTFGKKRYVNANHIRPIKDVHEVYFHILESISVNLILERGPPGGPGAGSVQQQTSTSAYTAQSHATSVKDEYAHLPPLQRAIVEFILSQPRQEEGINVRAIARAISTDGDAQKLSDALDKLMDDGHIFSTINDSHFNVSI